MSENRPESQDPLAFKPEQKIDRREFLKKSAKTFGGLLGVYGGGSLIRDHVEGNNPVKGAYDLLASRTDVSNPSSILENFPGSPILPEREYPYNDDEEIRAIEQRLNIRLVSLPDALAMMGIPFNEKDTHEYGDILPIRFDLPRAQMVEKYFDQYLPNYFHEPDTNGNPLVLTLTNYGANNSVGGEYFIDRAHNLMKLDYDVFSPNNPDGALQLLTHESVHYFQDQGSSRMTSKLSDLLGSPGAVRSFSEKTIKKLDELNQEINDTDTFVFLGQLRYGVENVLDNADEATPRDTVHELEASLSEVYLHGRDHFIGNLSKVYGSEIAERFYDYMRYDVFGGREYEKFPLKLEEEKKDQETLETALELYNTISGQFIQSDQRDTAGLAYLSGEDPTVFEQFENKDITLSEHSLSETELGEKTVTINVKVGNTQVLQEKTADNAVLKEDLTFYVNELGQAVPMEEAQELKQERRKEIAERLFFLPENASISWENEDLVTSEHDMTASYDHEGYSYTYKIYPDGLVTCKKRITPESDS